MKNFYDFSSCHYLTTFAARADKFEKCLIERNGEAGGEFYDSLILGDYKNIEFPVIFRKMRGGSSGNKMRDILDTRYPPLHLISDRFKAILEDTGMTGWKSYPIILYDARGNSIEGYNGFSIVGRAGEMRKYDIPPIELGYSPKSDGYYFDVDTWDGSDIFILENSRCVVVTENFIKMLRTNKITACEYIRLEDFGDYSKYKKIH